MSFREAGWVLFLAGLPFAHFLFQPRLDIWHGQSAWAHGWILALFGWMLSQGGKRLPNRPLAVWMAWISGSTFWVWTAAIISQKLYPIPLLLGVMHGMMLLLFYQAATGCWTIQFLSTLCRWIARAGVFVMLYGILQLLNLDQFFRSIDSPTAHDPLVGTIGNPSHFGAYLAFLFPLLLLQSGWWWKGWSVLAVILTVVTGSIGALLGMVVAGTWCLWFKSKKFTLIALALTLIAGVCYLKFCANCLNPHGRMEAWGEFWKLFISKPITGLGWGFVMDWSRAIKVGSPIFHWRHVHLEWFQIAIEQGIIGLGLVLWCLWEWARLAWKTQKTPLVVALTGVMLAFLVNSCVNFPMHLWLLGSFGLLAYCGIHVIANKDFSCR